MNRAISAVVIGWLYLMVSGVSIAQESYPKPWKDKDTGLIWMSEDSGEPGDWGAAANYCRVGSVGDRPGWRVPTYDEVMTVWQGSHFKKGISLRSKSTVLWTATEVGPKAVVFIPGANRADMRLLPKNNATPVVLCVRKPLFGIY